MYVAGSGEVMADLYETFAKHGIGREIVLYAKKEGENV